MALLKTIEIYLPAGGHCPKHSQIEIDNRRSVVVESPVCTPGLDLYYSLDGCYVDAQLPGNLPVIAISE
jgi:hypothetical protein